MIFVQQKGRMGNQMFQIATAYAVAKDNNDSFICTDRVLALSPHTMDYRKKLRNTIFRKIIFDHSRFNPSFFHTDEQYFHFKKIIYNNMMCLSGYYQSFKYFDHLRNDIIDLFEPSKLMIEQMKQQFSLLLSENNTCSVHVRRGDYLKYKNCHHNLSDKYYKNAMSDMGKNMRFVFFSDDIEWCRTTFSDFSEDFINTGDDLLDFWLMSYMKNNIIANSSYGWWSAYLNLNEDKKIICPKNWFGPANSHLNTFDLFPKEWKILTDNI